MMMECEKTLRRIQKMGVEETEPFGVGPFYYHICKDGELNFVTKFIYEWI